MKRSAFPFLVASLLLWCGCSNPSEVEDPEQVLIVQAYLSPGQEAEVKLRQTMRPDRFYDGREDTVSGAAVEILVGEETYALSEDPQEPGTYRIAAGILSISSGHTYHLRVTNEDRQARASTTVPEQAEIYEVSADTIVYFQRYATLYGELAHPGEFHWHRSPDAAGYVVIVEAVEVRSLSDVALPLTADLDSLIAQRERLAAQSAPDTSELDDRIESLRAYFDENISLVGADGDTIRWLRDRDQQEWDRIDTEPWSEGRKWREKREQLYWNRLVDYWVPADTLRGDYWWLGVRFEGEYRLRLQAADRNYFDYFTTSFNGQSGNDADKGPLFHVSGGVGVFGSYAEDSFRVLAERGEEGQSLKIVSWK